jgi:hypothetical protein
MKGSLVSALRLGLLGLLVTACRPSPPPRWAEGGATLILPSARWHRDGDVIEIQPSGQVLEDGDVIFVVDRVGRVVDEDHDPVALLLPNGALAGNAAVDLGQVGRSNASPPTRAFAWLSLRSDGSVQRFDADGERSADGHWEGCIGSALRTCTLVTHLIALREYGRRPTTSVGIGIGVGF